MSDPYFAAPTGTPTEPGRFTAVADLPPLPMFPGLEVRPMFAANVMLSFVRYDPDTVVPMHAHEEQQVFIVLEGEFEIDLDGEVRKLLPGEIAVMPSWVPHKVTAGADGGYQIDVFNPPRETLVDELAALGITPATPAG